MPDNTPKGTDLTRNCKRLRPNPTLLKAIYSNLAEGCSVELACWSENVNPEDFQKWSEEDQSIWRRTMKEMAQFERKLLRKVQEGGKTLCQSRASLELLSRTSQRYAPKTTVTIRKELEDVLDEFERQLDPETYMKVLNIIESHSR